MTSPLEHRSPVALHASGEDRAAVLSGGVQNSTSHGTEQQTDGPIPMSLPAILRNPRLRHLQPPPVRTRPGVGQGIPSRGDAYVGRRRMRRNENNRFLSNPHTSRPTPSDFQVQPNKVRSTFVTQRDANVGRLESIAESRVPDFASPQHASATFEVDSALKGQFSMSLKDAQQFLRARRSTTNWADGVAQAMYTMSLSDPVHRIPPAPATFIEQLIETAEREISTWLQQTVHRQDGNAPVAPREILARPASSVRNSTAILEVRRTPALLVWHIDDAYNRLAVHCVARVLNCPSFSRPVLSGDRATGGQERHTWILHCNPLVRGRRTRASATQLHRPRHARTDSTSTVGSTTSSAIAVDTDPSPLTAGILQHAFDGVQSPPVTDFEYTSTEEFTGSERGDTVSDVDW
ncbi:hypothetical protein CBS14141_001510 [Malassezia furfur]|nr:hypothetical protein CBS14141_001510 [Malassezia furfur]